MEPEGQANAYDGRRNIQVDNAIRAIQEKKPVPEIDFTIHTMEDGTQVSTMERVCKGAFVRLSAPSSLPHRQPDCDIRPRRPLLRSLCLLSSLISYCACFSLA